MDRTGQYVKFANRDEGIGRFVGTEPRACDPIQVSSIPPSAFDIPKYQRQPLTRLTTFEVDDFIQVAGAEYGVDPLLIHAIIKQESDYQPRAESIKGAKGLMQLMDATASDYGVIDAFDPEQNIVGGTAFLADLFSEFADIDLVLAAYNAGPQRVREITMLKRNLFLVLVIGIAGCNGVPVPSTTRATDLRVIYQDLNPTRPTSTAPSALRRDAFSAAPAVEYVAVRRVVDDYATSNGLRLIELPGDEIALDSVIMPPGAAPDSIESLTEVLGASSYVSSVVVDDASRAIRVIAQEGDDE
ncbi:unnamed protein product [Cyprideis torosa]|uniref:Uncharacterized protein n=1 Tax=Cyprideis torosa TaxID=163714 RepID=A0A7R8ZLZ4_9CRUS|nr:unnamed protein product [Cyprideis torosa]CAG0893005.1 unnamed protein product [Cyprideis torosa]